MGGIDKMFWQDGGESILERTVAIFYSMGFEDIAVAVREDSLMRAKKLLERFSPNVRVVCGGKSRAESVKNALEGARGEYVLIHDGARPYVTPQLIERVALAAEKEKSAVAVVKVTDTVKVLDERGMIVCTPPREKLALAQTPQGFEKNRLLQALRMADDLITDEATAYEKMYGSCFAVEGEYNNRKITNACDLLQQRTGIGYDTHALAEKRKLILGGVEIAYHKGLLGHSDADVLLHAVCDAILTGAGLRDIGYHFPDTDAAYAGISSVLLLQKVLELIDKEGWRVSFVSAVVMAEKPKLSSYADAITKNVSKILGAPFAVSFTTCEKLGFIGREEGIAAFAAATLAKKEK